MSTSSSPSPPPAHPFGSYGWCFPAGIALLGLATAWLLRGYEVDDAYIYYRYADNIVAGHGAVFNLGERLHTIASPLWLLLLLPGAWLGVLPAWGHLLTGATCTAAGLVCWRALTRRGASLAGLLAALLLVTHLPLQQAVGLEMPMAVLLTMLAALWWHRPLALAAVLGALPLARPEAGAVSALGMAWLAWLAVRGDGDTRRWARWGLLLTPSLVVLGLTPATLYYGSPLPNSLPAKMAQGASGKWGEGWLILAELGRAWLTLRVLPVLLLASAGLWASLRALRLRSLLVPLLGMALLPIAGWTALGIPPYRWYFLPIEATALVLAALGLDWLLAAALARSHPRLRGLVPLACLVPLLALRPLVPAYADPALFDQDRVAAYRDIGEHIAAHAPASVVIAAGEVGMLGYHSRREVVDLLGIVTPFDPTLHTGMAPPQQLAATRAELFVTNADAPRPPGFALAFEADGFVLLRRRGPGAR
jgi:arabinofuranosyltransferase